MCIIFNLGFLRVGDKLHVVNLLNFRPKPKKKAKKGRNKVPKANPSNSGLWFGKYPKKPALSAQ